MTLALLLTLLFRHELRVQEMLLEGKGNLRLQHSRFSLAVHAETAGIGQALAAAALVDLGHADDVPVEVLINSLWIVLFSVIIYLSP